jgi:hypothetical protein
LYSETEAKLFLQFYEQTAQVELNQFMETTWNYVTNITKPNQEKMVWYHLPPQSLFPLLFLVVMGVGDPTSCPLSRARGKREVTKHIKIGCKLQASWWPQKTLSA